MNRRSVGRSLPSLSFFHTILSLNSLQLAFILGAAHYLPTLVQEKDPLIYAQASSKDPAERIKAKTKIKTNVTAIKQALRRIYKLNTDTFHTFLIDLIPRARDNKSHLFTRIKAEREQHLVRQRVYKNAKGTPTTLTARQSKPHSALHTLEFIEQHYVKENENSVHILWT